MPAKNVDVTEEFTEDTIYDELLEKEQQKLQNLRETGNSTEDITIDDTVKAELRDRAKLLFKLRSYNKRVMEAKAKSVRMNMCKGAMTCHFQN